MKFINIKNLLLPFLLALCYFLFNVSLIMNDSFDEDAYILFRYVDMFNKGFGITYYPNSVPLEGATDFLWLVMLIIVSKLGLDIGTSAILLNSIGVFIISLILILKIKEINDKLLRILLGSICVIWITFYPLQAALGGFSVMLYCAFFLVPFYLIDRRKYLEYIPLFSILLGLFRPDGVLLGIGLSFIAFIYLYDDKKRLKSFLIFSISALIIGFIYFIWRYNYFGNLLPLPLYVKQGSGAIVNFVNNFEYSFTYKHIYIYLIVLLIVVFTNFKISKNKLPLLLPSFILFIFISCSTQSQNVGFRFQSPIIISMIYVTISIVVTSINNSHSIPKYLYLMLPAFYILAGLKSINEIKYSYEKVTVGISLPEFFYKLSNNILKGDEVLAITEAGYFAYYQQKENPIIDLVGLNSSEFAKNYLNQKSYDSINPDLIYFMRANEMAPSNFQGKLYYKVNNPVEFNSAFKSSIQIINEQGELDKVVRATRESIKYLNRHFSDYDIYFIRYRKNDVNRLSSYVFALRKTKGLSKKFENLLDELLTNDKVLNYYDIPN